MSWTLAIYVLLFLALAAGFAWYERSRPPAKVVALAAVLAALAIAGRIAFAPLPNVKPTTDIVLFAGYAIGAAPGFAVGAVSAVASNLFFGQGPWTPWQMAAWGGVGVAGAALGALARARGRDLGRWPLAAACALAGLAFGAVMDLFQWTLTAGHDLGSYLAVSATSLPFNLAHAIGNVVFCLVLGPPMIRALRRYRRRFEVRWAAPTAAGSSRPIAGPVSAAPVAAVAVAAGLALLAAAPPARAASASARAAGYLAGAQNRDGGFGDAPGHGSAQLFTGWSALGLAAAGRNPRDVRHGGASALDYTRAHSGSLHDTGQLERTILVLGAAGVSPRHFSGRDLLAELLRRRGGDGSFNHLVNLTAFGVLAMRAAGVPAGDGRVQGAADWLEGQRNGDGGFGFSTSAASDADDTGAVLEALGAAGRGGSSAASGAVGYLNSTQNGDGGFSSSFGSSNAQSTAWAVQGLVAVGQNPDGLRRGGHTPLGYLVSLQARDGSIRYARGSTQTPVWVTAQALAALRRRAFPIAAVPRSGRAHRAGVGAASAPGGAGGGGAAGQGAAAAGSTNGPNGAAVAQAAQAIAAAEAGRSPFDAISAVAGRPNGGAAGPGAGAAAAGSPVAAGVAAAASLLVLLAAEWRRRRGRSPGRVAAGPAVAAGGSGPAAAGSPSG